MNFLKTLKRRNVHQTEKFSDGILAWFPFLVCFIVIPLAIYKPNQSNFDYNFWAPMPLLVLGVLTLLIISVLWFTNPVFRKITASSLFYLGAFIFLTDVVAPLDWDLIDGSNYVQEPVRLNYIEAGVVFILFIASRIVSMRLLRVFGVTFIIFLIFIQSFSFASILFSTYQHDKILAKSKLNNYSTANQQNLGNIYHIVFDAYSSNVFMKSLKLMQFEEDFSGFIFFENNLANYQSTDASIPSFMTGTFYKQGSFRQWQNQSITGGIRKSLQEIGYNVSLYVPTRADFWMYENAQYSRTSHELANEFRKNDSMQLAQISLVRVAPNFLRQETYSHSPYLFNSVSQLFSGRENSDSSGFYKEFSVPLYRMFLKEENERASKGNYVYVHLVLPHPPFKWSHECDYSPDGKATDFLQQSHCSTRLMVELIQKLKMLNRYDSSTIIFQSDHGYHGEQAGSVKTDVKLSEAFINKISKQANYLPPQGFFRRTHSLLAIKRPLSPLNPLIISQAQTQLADIPATIYDILDIEGPENDGASVYELDINEAREISVFGGVTFIQNGKTRKLGSTLPAHNLAHFSYLKGRGWRIKSDILATTEESSR